MIKTVLDSNVYVSALGFGGKPKDIVLMGLNNFFRIVISEFIINEVTDICTKKIGLSKSELDVFFEELVSCSDLIKPAIRINIAKHKADNIIIAAAVDSGSDYVVTGDKAHLLPIGDYRDVRIVTVKQFIDVINANTKY